MIEDVVKKLLKNYDEFNPVAVVYKATWKIKILGGTGEYCWHCKKLGLRRLQLY